MPVSAPSAVAAPRSMSGKHPRRRKYSFGDSQQSNRHCRESNAHAFAFTPHACENNNYHVCEDTTCGGTYSEDRFAGDCDANGCDYNPYRVGNTDFYGKGMTVDTSKKFT